MATPTVSLRGVSALPRVAGLSSGHREEGDRPKIRASGECDKCGQWWWWSVG